MPQQTYDPCSKWLLGKRGSALLWVAGVRRVASCEAAQAEVVHPLKLPDGLLKAVLSGKAEEVLFLLEVATYSEARVVTQMVDDLRLVRQAKGVLPEGIVLCLSPKGTYRIPETATEACAQGFSTETYSWKAVNLWEMPASQLLEAPDVGAVPWATLCKYDGPPEVLLQRCKDRIEKEGGDLRGNLLAVSHVLAKMHYDKPGLLSILGDEKMLMDMPFFVELVGKSKREERVETILEVLASRFDPPGEAIEAGLKQAVGPDALTQLTRIAAVCRSLEDFHEELSKHLPKPPPVSTRGGKRKKKAE